ncbi:MAG: hypothetical protein ACO20Y_07950 [Poseidonia sp.]
MNPNANPQSLTFSDLRSTGSCSQPVPWSQQSRTALAHASGRLPASTHNLGWQPFAGPGSSPESKAMSVTLRSLHRRVRGEA